MRFGIDGIRAGLVGVLTAAVGVSVHGASLEIDSALPEYERVSGVSGAVRSMGSDTMNNIMTGWGEEFTRFYPAVQVEVEGKGSSTAPPALIEGQAQFGPMSRPMKAGEVDKFKEAFGYEPTLLRTGIDCLAVFVHKDCPLNEISLDQIAEIFGASSGEMTWGDIGVEDASWVDQPISLYGRNSASGTYGYFKSVGLGGDDYKETVKEQPGSSAVVQAIAAEPYAMGYSGIGYINPSVKALSVSFDGGESFQPNAEYAGTGDYPLARFLYVYVNKDPRETFEPLRAEFIRMIFSRTGQQTVEQYGYFPVSGELAREELSRVGLLPEG